MQHNFYFCRAIRQLHKPNSVVARTVLGLMKTVTEAIVQILQLPWRATVLDQYLMSEALRLPVWVRAVKALAINHIMIGTIDNCCLYGLVVFSGSMQQPRLSPAGAGRRTRSCKGAAGCSMERVVAFSEPGGCGGCGVARRSLEVLSQQRHRQYRKSREISAHAQVFSFKNVWHKLYLGPMPSPGEVPAPGCSGSPIGAEPWWQARRSTGQRTVGPAGPLAKRIGTARSRVSLTGICNHIQPSAFVC